MDITTPLDRTLARIAIDWRLREAAFYLPSDDLDPDDAADRRFMDLREAVVDSIADDLATGRNRATLADPDAAEAVSKDYFESFLAEAFEKAEVVEDPDRVRIIVQTLARTLIPSAARFILSSRESLIEDVRVLAEMVQEGDFREEEIDEPVRRMFVRRRWTREMYRERLARHVAATFDLAAFRPQIEHVLDRTGAGEDLREELLGDEDLADMERELVDQRANSLARIEAMINLIW